MKKIIQTRMIIKTNNVHKSLLNDNIIQKQITTKNTKHTPMVSEQNKTVIRNMKI